MVGIWEVFKLVFFDSFVKNFGISLLWEYGFVIVLVIEVMYNGKVKVFFVLGGNFLFVVFDIVYIVVGF